MNRYGLDPRDERDYLKVADSGDCVVNDVSNLNLIKVSSIIFPSNTDEIVRSSDLPLSIGGGHFSMGGTTASPGTVHIDMRKMHRIVSFNPEEKLIRVQAGVRWCDVQRFVDPHGLAVKIMQTYANFTVGGSLSVNAHGRCMGLGPIVLSVKNLQIVFANGEVVDANRSHNSDTDAALALAKQGAKFEDIAGNDTVILVTILSQDASPTSIKPLFTQRIYAQDGLHRHGLILPVEDLSRFLIEVSSSQDKIEHIYDY